MSNRITLVGSGLLPLLLLSTLTQAAEPEHTDEEAHAVEEILVTPSPLAHTTDELAIPVNVVDRDHLLGHLGTTIGDTLRQEPGITTSSFAAGSSRPVVRGQDTFRVRILDDGSGTHDASPISADHGVPINPLTARRIEVVRGPATLRYGSGAIAGVVNAITGRVPRQLFESPLQGELFTGYETGNRGRDAAVLLEGSAGPFSYHLDALTRDSDDYDVSSRPGKQGNSDTDAWSGSAGVALIGDQGRIGVAWSKFENEYGIPIGPDESEGVSIDLDKKSWDVEADLFEPLPWLSEVRFRGRYSDYDHAEVEDGAALSRFDNDEWEGRLEFLHAPIGGFEGAVGLHQRDIELSAAGEGRELLAPTETNLLGAYLYEDLEVSNRLTFHLGARIEDVEVKGTPQDDRRRSRSFTPLSGAVGLLFDATENIQVGLTLSASQRAPEALELFARGPHEADETFQVGDPDFDEETSYTADLLVRGSWDRLHVEGSLFYTEYDEFIFGRLTGRTCDETDCGLGGTEFDELVYTQEDGYFVGGELEARYHLADLFGGEIGLDAQLDYVRARLDDSGNVPRITPMRWGGGLWFDHDRVRSRIGFLHHERQSKRGDFEDATSGFTFVDATTSIRVYEGRTPVDLILSVRNLFDAKGRNHVSFNKDDVLYPGRTARIAFDVTF